MNRPSAVELEVQRTRELLKERRFAAALRATDALLATVPENRDVLYLRAVAQRHLGDTAAALATLTGSNACIRASAASTRNAATATSR